MQRALYEINPAAVLHAPEPKETPSVPEKAPEPETPIISIDDIKESTTVHNKTYGDGVVAKIDGDKIYVDFKASQRIFKYPIAFEKGWLTL